MNKKWEWLLDELWFSLELFIGCIGCLFWFVAMFVFFVLFMCLTALIHEVIQRIAQVV